MGVLINTSDPSSIKRARQMNVAVTGRAREKRIEKLGDDRLWMAELDCTNEDASAVAFMGYDVVVNCAHILSYYLNTTRGALRAGANFIDLGSSGQDKEIFELSDEFRARWLNESLNWTASKILLILHVGYGTLVTF